jgi:hypothetical protein
MKTTIDLTQFIIFLIKLMQSKKIIKIVLKQLKVLMVKIIFIIGVSEEDRLKKSKLDENKFCGTKHWETNYNSVIKDPYA